MGHFGNIDSAGIYGRIQRFGRMVDFGGNIQRRHARAIFTGTRIQRKIEFVCGGNSGNLGNLAYSLSHALPLLQFFAGFGIFASADSCFRYELDFCVRIYPD